MQPKGAARSRQADDMAASLPDEQLWLWMTQGSASAKTGRQQRKGALTCCFYPAYIGSIDCHHLYSNTAKVVQFQLFGVGAS